MKIFKLLVSLVLPIIFSSNFEFATSQSASNSTIQANSTISASDNFFHVSEISTNSIENDDKKRVLYLGSYSTTWLSQPALIDEISNGLSDTEYDVDFKYLNTKDIEYNDEYKEFLKETYEVMFEGKDPYDAIIISDDDALDFVMSNNSEEEELFYGIPSFFVGVNSETKALAAAEKDNICGLLESINYKKSIEQVLSLMENTDVINYIADSTNTGEANAEAFEKAVEDLGEFSSINRINPSNMTLNEFEDELSKIESTEITYDLSFSRDVDGNTYNTSQQESIYDEYADFPMFSDNNTSVYAGSVHYDFNKAGSIVAGYVNDYLMNGLDISNIDIISDDMNTYEYNISKLFEYGLNYENLPDDENIEFANFGSSFKYEYKNIYELIIIITPIALIILAVLSYFVYRNHKIGNEHRQKMKNLKYASSHDALTGLLQKDSFYKEVTKLIKVKSNFALVVINIDNLNETNGFYGRDKGDDILVNLVNSIKSLPGFNYGFYSSYDEFQIVVPYLSREELDVFIKQMNEISFSAKLDGINEKRVSATAGVSLYPEDSVIGSELLEHAYAAMQYGKTTGKHKLVFYNQTMQDSDAKMDTYNTLIETIKNDEFELFFQPIVDIKTGELFKFEALLRIQDSTLSPGVFIPVAEETGLINGISKKVVKMACEFERKMNECKIIKNVSINFSHKQIGDHTFCDYFKETVDNNEIDIQTIEIEITEATLQDDSGGVDCLLELLKKEGITISLDDFGTGFSALDSLFAEPIKYVKVDKDLAEDLCSNVESFKSLISFFHKANLKVVIEGIEVKDLVEICVECNVDYIQGYYFSKPLPEHEALNILTKNYLEMIK